MRHLSEWAEYWALADGGAPAEVLADWLEDHGRGRDRAERLRQARGDRRVPFCVMSGVSPLPFASDFPVFSGMISV